MSDIAIRVENLGKQYHIGAIEKNGGRYTYKSLRDSIASAASAPFRAARALMGRNGAPENHQEETIWALKDVSFDVKQGEIVGVIGRNGAGKSTLLKILSRITEPTTGHVEIRGRVGSLLEVGTGFHPELTGRDNVYLNGAILGMKRAEIARNFDAIVAFAEVEKFIDTPVKHYSSGMYLRLAFAVAAHLQTEILMVDEVLAVGDAQFQKKCLGKMHDVSEGGRTVLFVSHNMTAVQSLCRRALMMNKGKLVADGPVALVVPRYLRESQVRMEEEHWTQPLSAPGNDLIRIKRVRVLPDDNSSGPLLTMQTPLRIETEYWVMKAGVITHLTYHLLNDQGVTVLTSGCRAEVREPGVYRAVCQLPANLLNSGGYFLKLFIVRNENTVTYENDDIASFDVEDTAERGGAYMGREPGVVQPLLAWTTEGPISPS
jgi:lipopolysaccharide transport system ATP-binding protein